MSPLALELARSQLKNADGRKDVFRMWCTCSVLSLLADGSPCSSASMEYNISVHSSDVDMHIVH